MTKTELLALPVAIDLTTAARAFGIGRATAYDLARRGDFPVPVQRVGRQLRVTRTDLLAALNVDEQTLGAA